MDDRITDDENIFTMHDDKNVNRATTGFSWIQVKQVLKRLEEKTEKSEQWNLNDTWS